jgi:hypothetical protein
METLIEKLYNNNVIFSYYGFIDHTVLSQVLKITGSKLESQNEEPVVVRRVQEALSDCVENIIDTLNVINSHQKKVIDRQLEFLNSHSRQELKEVLATHNEAPVSSSLIKMMLKADAYDCSFKKVENNYLFNINFKICAPIISIRTGK